MSSTTKSSMKVLVIGGGVSGLAFANGLQKHNIPFHLYERDASPAFRAQGYRVRLAGEGLKALRYLLDDTTWSNFELTCADMRLRPIPGVDATTGKTNSGGLVFGEKPPPQAPQGLETPRTVDRTVLREVLLKGLKKGSVSYGKSLDKYGQNEEGVTAFFEDGSSATGTLIVGADGARSHVRRQRLPGLETIDTGGRCIYGKTHLTEEMWNKVAKDILGGMSGVQDRSGEDIMSMVIEPVTFPRRAEMKEAGFSVPEDYLYWVLVSNPTKMGFSKSEWPRVSPTEAEQLARRLTSSWDPSLRIIFEHQVEQQTAVLAINTVDPDFLGGSWEPDSQITLIGDAIGLMGPTAGSGAITAIRDAERLCQKLAESGQSKEAIGEYEKEMKEFTVKTIAISNEAGKHMYLMRSADAKPLDQLMTAVRDKRGQDDIVTSSKQTT